MIFLLFVELEVINEFNASLTEANWFASFVYSSFQYAMSAMIADTVLSGWQSVVAVVCLTAMHLSETLADSDGGSRWRLNYKLWDTHGTRSDVFDIRASKPEAGGG